MSAAATVTIADPEFMHRLGVLLGSALQAGDLLVLTGPLGAGKTTLTRGIGDGLGIRGPVTSPTFVIARTHPSERGGPALVHVDAYRVGSAMELDDLDIDFARSVVVAEWGEGLLDGVADSWLDVRIERPTGADDRGDDQGAGDPEHGFDEPVEARLVRLEAHGPRWEAADLEALVAPLLD